MTGRKISNHGGANAVPLHLTSKIDQLVCLLENSFKKARGFGKYNSERET